MSRKELAIPVTGSKTPVVIDVQRHEVGAMAGAAAEGACIVCGHLTPDKFHGGGFRGARRCSDRRCADGEECAVRRNAGKRRPRPEAEVRTEWRKRHPAGTTQEATP